MRLLITGGAGFIGTNATSAFLPKCSGVTIFDNFSRKTSKKNADYLKSLGKKVTIIKGEVQDKKLVTTLVERNDVILHLAGQVAVTTSLLKPFKDFSTNVLGSMTVLEAARKHNPKAILIYSSTNKVYGSLKKERIPGQARDDKNDRGITGKGISETQPLDFYSPYGCSKGTADQYFRDYYRSFGLRTVVFRQSCIYGPHQYGMEDQGWLAHFALQYAQKKPITLYGTGNQVRDILYVDDLTTAYLSAIDKIDQTQGEIFNCGGGPQNALSLTQALSLLSGEFGYNVSIKHADKRLGDQDYFVSDNSKLKKTLGWKPKTDYREGIRKLVEWIKSQQPVRQVAYL